MCAQNVGFLNKKAKLKGYGDCLFYDLSLPHKSAKPFLYKQFHNITKNSEYVNIEQDVIMLHHLVVRNVLQRKKST